MFKKTKTSGVKIIKHKLFLQQSKWDKYTGEDVKGCVFMCFLSSGLLNWQVDDALNQCSSTTANPMKPISELR